MDRVESQEELHRTLDKCFNGKATLDYNGFVNIIEHLSSDIFLFILVFLLEKRPFSMKSVKEYDKLKPNSFKISKSPIQSSRLIASPSLQSKFMPSVTISKSPIMRTRNIFKTDTQKDAKAFLANLAGKANQADKTNPLLKYAGKVKTIDKPNDILTHVSDAKALPVSRKPRAILRNLEKIETLEKNDFSNHKVEEMPINPAVKYHPQGIGKTYTDDILSGFIQIN